MSDAVIGARVRRMWVIRLIGPLALVVGIVSPRLASAMMTRALCAMYVEIRDGNEGPWQRSWPVAMMVSNRGDV